MNESDVFAYLTRLMQDQISPKSFRDIALDNVIWYPNYNWLKFNKYVARFPEYHAAWPTYFDIMQCGLCGYRVKLSKLKNCIVSFAGLRLTVDSYKFLKYCKQLGIVATNVDELINNAADLYLQNLVSYKWYIDVMSIIVDMCGITKPMQQATYKMGNLRIQNTQ